MDLLVVNRKFQMNLLLKKHYIYFTDVKASLEL